MKGKLISVLARTLSVCMTASSMGVLSVQASEEDWVLSPSRLETRLENCREFFDIEPYFALAVGADYEELLTEEVEASLVNFFATGELLLPEGLEDHPIALDCKTYVEGMLTGGLYRLIVSSLKEALGLMFEGLFGLQ